jgi:TPR repeat protein
MIGTCPFCKANRKGITAEEAVEQLMKRVEANDALAMFVLGNYYYHGEHGLLQDREKALELWTQAAKLGSSDVHYELGIHFHEGGRDMKKAKFHLEAAAIAGHEGARSNLGDIEGKSGNGERAVKHWTIAASAGSYDAMHALLIQFKDGALIRDAIDLTLTAYNSSCKEMRSEARDAFIRTMAEINDHGM